jgi:hypothetical protein
MPGSASFQRSRNFSINIRLQVFYEIAADSLLRINLISFLEKNWSCFDSTRYRETSFAGFLVAPLSFSNAGSPI